MLLTCGKEVDGQAGADAFFVAEEEDVFQFRQRLAADGEDDLVDDMLA